MHVRFWGTRGSLPKPGPHTLRFGGNTSCVEVRTSSNTLLIIDCGSGLHGLGQALMAAENTVENGHILISHTHWDHIQGIPFFAPFFVPGKKWQIYAPSGLGQSLQETLAGQMQYSYFPVRLDQMGAEIGYHELVEGTFDIEGVRINTRYMNYTALTLGFRIEADGAVLVYATDHEPFMPQLASGRGEISGRDRRHCEFLSGADLLIHDAQFTADEYSSRIGWGHSTIEYATAVARAGGARRLAFTHHDPLRTDDALEKLERAARDSQPAGAHFPDIIAAAEGQLIELGGHARPVSPKWKSESSLSNGSALLKPILVIAVEDPLASGTIREAAQSDGITVIDASNTDEAMDIGQSAMPSVVVVDRRWTGPNCNQHAKRGDAAQNPAFSVPVIIVAEAEHGSELAEEKLASGIELLIKPFSNAYARTLIRASLLRTACRWQRVLTTPGEEKRLELLHALEILDTPPEDRFDRITRLAASIFDAPMALISLVDRDRQWFKSAYGMKVGETSRETSFCAHAVHSRNLLVVPDTFQDCRFSDNPLVTDAPRIRFYAGFPLFVGEHCMGTICVLDYTPRQIDSQAVGLLRDLAALAETELNSKLD